MPKIFISHAAADKHLVDDLKQMIQTAVGLAPGEFFYSSGKGTGVPAGHNFVEYIRDEIDDATFVVSVVTPAFRESEFCLAELGAVWVSVGKAFCPLCTPDVNRGDLRATLAGIQVERIDDDASLADLLQRICSHFAREYNAPACVDAVNAFRATLPARLTGLAGATKVPVEELEQAQSTIQTLGQQVTELRDRLAAEQDRYDKLREAKTREEVETLDIPGDLEGRVEHLLKAARSAARGLDADVKAVLPFALRGDGMPWPDRGSWEGQDVAKEVDKGFLIDGDDGRVYLNTEWPDIEEALDALRALHDLLRQLDPDEEKWFRREYGVPADLTQTAVFDELF